MQWRNKCWILRMTPPQPLKPHLSVGNASRYGFVCLGVCARGREKKRQSDKERERARAFVCMRAYAHERVLFVVLGMFVPVREVPAPRVLFCAWGSRGNRGQVAPMCARLLHTRFTSCMRACTDMRVQSFPPPLIERQADRQAGRQADRQRGRQTDRQRERGRAFSQRLRQRQRQRQRQRRRQRQRQRQRERENPRVP